MTPSTLVVGGGLAGLLAARRHQRAGRQVVLVEAADTVGGAIAAITVGELTLNAGAEAYSIGAGAVDALVEELGLADRVASPREGLGSRVVSDAGVHLTPGASLLGIPSRPLAADVRAVLGTAGAVRASLERFLPAAYGNRPGATVATVVRKRLGPAVLERLVAPIIGGVHSADSATLEFAAASPQLADGLQAHGSLTQTVKRLRGGSGTSAGARVHTLSPTMAALPTALRAAILADGGLLRTGVEAASLERSGPRWVLRTTGDETLESDHLVLACPPGTARELLSGAVPEISDAIPQTPSAAVRLVALVLDAPALDAFPSGTGALVAPGTAGIRAKALTHVSAKWEHVQAFAREALPSAASPHVVRLSFGRPGERTPGREEIVDLALADASRILGVPLGREQLLEAGVIDWDRAMSQPLPGHRDSLDALTGLLEALDTVSTLELVGSWRAGTGIDAIVRADAALTAPSPTSPATEGHPS